MAVVVIKRNTLEERVSRSFYDFGRFASAHPSACLTLCILTIVVLSYPAVSRVKLPVSSPMDVYWTAVGNPAPPVDAPEWLHLRPAVYLQQVMVRAWVKTWTRLDLTPVLGVKGPLSRAFVVEDVAERAGLDDFCFRVPGHPTSMSLFPGPGCLVFSPTRFWESRNDFLKDPDILDTVFQRDCSWMSTCFRDVLLGVPTRLSGIKPTYQTNRHRSIEFSVTIVQAAASAEFRNTMIQELSKSFDVSSITTSPDQPMVHVFYRPRKYFTDYFPLVTSYLILMLYFYFTVSKFEMVKSKWGLAFAAFNTTFWTLGMSSGICAHLELISTLWLAGLYPYLAMIISLENTLCITRSIVYTAPTMAVSGRVAHGLSHEGWNISKYFVLEMSFLGLAYLTRVTEIQEFCAFAFITLVVDLYMQLFFYVPILYFDLYRLGHDEKIRFSEMLFKSDLRKLQPYPSPNCPARLFLPWLFSSSRIKQRRFSESMHPPGSSTIAFSAKPQRRTKSIDKLALIKAADTPIAYRLRVLYFWTRTRFVQRLVMAFFSVWVVWLAFVVHHWKLWEGLAWPAAEHTALDISNLHWQRQTFPWWPNVFDGYNISLSGQYITFLPPIVLSSEVPDDDESLQVHSRPPLPAQVAESHPELLQRRLTMMEQQMTMILVCSVFFPFLFVVSFILYVCFWNQWPQQLLRKSMLATEPVPVKATPGQRTFTELTPLLFSNHPVNIDHSLTSPPSMFIFSTMDGRVYTCDTFAADSKKQLARWRSEAEISEERARAQAKNEGRYTGPIVRSDKCRSQVWSMVVRSNLLAIGCADGSAEVADLALHKVIGRVQPPRTSHVGVTHVALSASKLVIGRIDGTVEVVGLTFQNPPHPRLTCNQLFVTQAHDRCLLYVGVVGLYLITAGMDRRVKVLDIRTMDHLHSLSHDDSSLVEVQVDDRPDSPVVLFTRCESGLICCWNIEAGELLYSVSVQIETASTAPYVASMALSTHFVTAMDSEGRLFVWDKSTGELVARLESSAPPSPPIHLTASLANDLLISAAGSQVKFWDVGRRSLAGCVELPLDVERLHVLDERSLLCVATSTAYRVDMPRYQRIRSKNC